MKKQNKIQTSSINEIGQVNLVQVVQKNVMTALSFKLFLLSIQLQIQHLEAADNGSRLSLILDILSISVFEI